jgi:O-antigen/teichoic acid export membrane protein/glycosyltransferase involved in cell wall biosynthesis/RNA-splicing ligase RtcB
MRREHVDIVHTHCSIPGVVGRVAARLAGVPGIVHTVHGFHFHPAMPSRWQRAYAAVERWCGRFTRMLLTQNRSDLDAAVAHGIGRPEARRWIGNGIELSRFEPARQRPAAATMVVTCVARFEPVKNHDQLLRAAAILHGRGVRFELWLVGDGPLRRALEAQAQAFGLAEVVRFLGYRDDIPELLAHTDIAVLTSVKEGIPRALVEAMAMQLPVVATNVKGNDEVVRHGADGFLVPLGDEHALAASLALLIEDPELRLRLGQSGRRRALEEFDEREIVRRLGELYVDLAPGRVRDETQRSGPADPPTAADDGEEPPAAAARAVARNAIFRLGAQVLSALINVAAMVLLGRALGPARFGEYAYCYAFIPMVATLCDLGAGMTITRDIARRPADGARLLADGLLIKCAMLVLLLLCVSVTVLVPVLSGSAGMAPFFLASLVVLAAAADPSQDPASWVLRARGRSDIEAALLVGSQALWLALLVLAARAHAPVAGLLMATLMAYAFRLLLGAALVMRRWGRPRLVWDLARLRTLVVDGLPFAGAMLTMVVYGRVGLLMLNALAGHGDMGQFQVAYLLSQPLGFVASALALAAFPMLAREAREAPAAAAERLRGLVRWSLVVAVPCAVALILCARPIIALLFHGADYQPAAFALRLMGPALPFVFLNLLARYALAAFGQQRDYLVAVLTGCAVNLALCAVLIPRLGVPGACAAFVAAELVVFALCQHALRRRVPFAGMAGDAVRPLIASAGMGAALSALGPSPAVPVAAAMGAGTYAAGMGFLAALRHGGPHLRRRGLAEHARQPHAAPAREPERDAAAAGRVTVLRTRLSDSGPLRELDTIAALPCVEAVLALPDLHLKPHMETPSSVAITTSGALVPEFTSVAVNDGMGVIVTDLDANDMTQARLTRLFARINSHAAANPLDANRYSLTRGDLTRALTQGGALAVRRYGLDLDVLRHIEWSGRFPTPVAPGELDDIVPRVLQGSRAVRSEMGLNFGGNHFLEAQVVDRVIDPVAARAWGLAKGSVLFMYHLGPGPFSGTLLHHFTRREKLPRARALAFFASKLLFHYLQRSPVRPAHKWSVHFRRNRWSVLAEGSEEAQLFQQALALAMNFGFAYRLTTVAAVRDALDEVLGARARLLTDVHHNGIAPETVDGRDVWVARHNACRLTPSQPAIIAGACDVPSYLALAAATPPAGLHSYDHGAGHLIERSRRHTARSQSGAHCVRVHMSRGRKGGVQSTEMLPLRSGQPIAELVECLERQALLRSVVRLRPIATLKN